MSRERLRAALRGALAGGTTGVLATLLALRVNDLPVADRAAVCSYALLGGIGAGLALGPASTGAARWSRFLGGFLAAPVGFLACSLAVKVVTGGFAWEDRWLPSVFLLEHGKAGLARDVLLVGLALGAGELAADRVSPGARPLPRARRAFGCGLVAALLGAIPVGLEAVVGREARVTAWLHGAALVPLAALATLVASLVLSARAAGHAPSVPLPTTGEPHAA